MKRSLFLAACLVALLSLAMTSAGADPSGTVPVAGGSAELSFTGTFTVTRFVAEGRQLRLEGTLNGPLSSSNGGVEADLSDLVAQLPVGTVEPVCEPPQVTVTTEAATVTVPGFEAITLEGLALVRTVDPADTILASQVCEIAGDLDAHTKLKGRRLAEAVDALNALGGTWQLSAPPAA
jgi:hypothetical protein